MCQPDGEGFGLSFGVGLGSFRSPHHRMKHRSPFVLFLVLLISSGLRGELEFSAFAIFPKSQLFVLRDKELDQTSGWITIGQSFLGHTLKSFDQKREVVTVQKDGRDLEIQLRESKIKDGKITVAGAISFGKAQRVDGLQKKDEVRTANEVRAVLFFDEENVIPLNQNVNLFIKPIHRADGNVEYLSRFVIRAEDGSEKAVSFPRVGHIPGHPFAIQVGDYGYRFVPQR